MEAACLMNEPTPDTPSAATLWRPDRLHAVMAALVIVGSLAFAYANSLHVPFLLDDEAAILQNPSIRDLHHMDEVLAPPTWATTARRPLLNLSYALNYAMGGYAPKGYHLANLAIHALSALFLYGLVRRTLVLPRLRPRFGEHSALLAGAIVLVWALDPLQVQSVTYLSQRAESLMGLCYILTLYLFVRAVGSSRPAPWLFLSVVACLLGASTKEIIATAPLLVLAYDRAFVSDSFLTALRRRGVYYAGLALSWVWLGYLMIHFGLALGVGANAVVSPWDYACTETWVIVHYLGLAFWPHPLVFDYGMEIVAHSLASVWPYALAVALLLGTSLVLWRRLPALGFLALSFFVLLAPTSSFVPVSGAPMGENRMYLPLAAVVAMALVVLYRLTGRGAVVVAAAIAVAFGFMTAARNRAFASSEAIWADTVAKCPGNSRAHKGLGDALFVDPAHREEAVAEYKESLKIAPGNAKTHCSLGSAYAFIPGHSSDSIEQFEEALRIDPNYTLAHENLGTALFSRPGRRDESLAHFETAVKLSPRDAHANFALGNALFQTQGRILDSVAPLETAVALSPNYFDAQYGLANVLYRIPGRLPEAIAHFKKATELDPSSAIAHYKLGTTYIFAGKLLDARGEMATTVRLDPSQTAAKMTLGRLDALLSKGVNPGSGMLR
jgi:protein O-mannosyl-transferase